MVRVTAILSGTHSAATARAGVRNILDTFAFEAQRLLQAYPPAQPWKGPTPTSGLRKGGRRTGTLGRNWRITARSAASVSVSNATPYAVYVQGDPDGGQGARQTDVMRARGWLNVTEVGEAAKRITAIKADLYPS